MWVPKLCDIMYTYLGKLKKSFDIQYTHQHCPFLLKCDSVSHIVLDHFFPFWKLFNWKISWLCLGIFYPKHSVWIGYICASIEGILYTDWLYGLLNMHRGLDNARRFTFESACCNLMELYNVFVNSGEIYILLSCTT